MHYKSKSILLAPTDLCNFLRCRHLTALDINVAKGQAERPVRYGALLEELKAHGITHERRYLKHLQNQGFSIAQAGDSDFGDQSTGIALERTITAMRNGADVIYQATLADGTWLGRADFLRRTELPSDIGDWSYEVIDTKLARDTTAGTILQLCVYSHLLEKIQGTRPEFMYVITPGNDFNPLLYRLDDYSAYFRLLDEAATRRKVSPLD